MTVMRINQPKPYAANRHFGDQFIRQWQHIAGEVFFSIATPQEDMEEATDLKMLKLDGGGDLGCRVRDIRQYPTHKFESYFRDFTIRYNAQKRTEFDKILDGFGDYMLYGWADSEIRHWVCINLDTFRDEWSRRPKSGIESHVIPNGDGTWFLAVKIATCSPAMFHKFSDKYRSVIRL